MKELRNNVILLTLGAIFASVGFVTNKFFEEKLFIKAYNIVCISPFEAFTIGLIILNAILISLFLYD